MLNTLTNMGAETKALFDSIHNPVIAIDTEGRVAFCNAAGERIMGLRQEDMVGKKLTRIIQNSQLFRILQTGKQELGQKIEIDGHTYASNRTIIKIGGQIIGAVAVLQDISELEALSNILEHTKLISAELEAIIESSFEVITSEYVPQILGGDICRNPLAALGERPLPELLAEVERSILEQALARYSTTRKIAHALKVNQSTVVRKTVCKGDRKVLQMPSSGNIQPLCLPHAMCRMCAGGVADRDDNLNRKG